jgi:hypothetical protein
MFDEQYYRDIWGSVHRHDYCETRANQLIDKYGKVKFLDIGTGCGYLVKLLNEKGAIAYGMEISQYAVDNSHGNVILGSVVDIPFKDNSFDVVFSQGLWEYVAEEDIQKAWLECNRVGKIQEHNYDILGSGLGEEDFVTAKPREWWEGKLKLPKILVAAPNHIVKEYAFQRWIDNVKSLTYPNYDILVIDNSPNTSDFMDRYKDQVPMRHIDTTGIEPLMVMRLNLSYEEIRKEFLSGDYERLMIIESDVIPPKDIIERMLKLGGDTDWISHAYPVRGETADAEQGIGCSLFTRRLMEAFNFKDFADNHSSDGGMWNMVRPDGRFTTMELWNYWKNVHLKE